MGDRARRDLLPPAKCSGTAEHNGQLCRRWAIPGTDRCKHHPISDPEPNPTEPDPVAERIARLERRPTARRMAEAARLRQPREHALTLHGQAPEPGLEPPAAPPTPAPVKPGRRITTLGRERGGQINRGVRP